MTAAGPRSTEYQLTLERGTQKPPLSGGQLLGAVREPGPSGRPWGPAFEALLEGFRTAIKHEATMDALTVDRRSGRPNVPG